MAFCGYCVVDDDDCDDYDSYDDRNLDDNCACELDSFLHWKI